MGATHVSHKMDAVSGEPSGTSGRWPGSPLLRAVGETLDAGLQCLAYEGGFVWPATKYLPPELAGVLEGVTSLGAEQEGAPSGSRGPAAGPRQGAAGGNSAEGPAGTDSGTAVVRQLRHASGADAIAGLAEALLRFPQFAVSSVSDGRALVRLSGIIQPIADLPIRASLVAFVDPQNPTAVTAFAWWMDGVWVGPRHTYANGSICAYELRDGTWRPDLGIGVLLAMHAEWLARQLFLRSYGRWPGRQMVHTPLERLAEQLPGELCGCGGTQMYEHCHAADDRARVGLADIARRRDELLHRGPMLVSSTVAAKS